MARRILPRRILVRTPAISRLGGGKNGRRAVYLDEMAIVHVLIVSEEQSSMTALAFGIAEEVEIPGRFRANVPTKTGMTLLNRSRPELSEYSGIYDGGEIR